MTHDEPNSGLADTGRDTKFVTRRGALSAVLSVSIGAAGCAQQPPSTARPPATAPRTTDQAETTPSTAVKSPVRDRAAWPAPGYDPRRRNRNPTVSIPTTPARVQSASVNGVFDLSQIAVVDEQLFLLVRRDDVDSELVRVGKQQSTVRAEDSGANLVAGPDGLLHLATLGVTTIRADSGEVVWDHDVEGKLFLTPTAETLYATGDQSVFAFDARTGELRWAARNLTQFMGPPAVDRERVYAAGVTGKVYAFDRATGDRRWTRQYTNAGPNFGPTLTDDLVVALQENLDQCWVIAYGKSDGELRWKVNMGADDLFGSSAAVYGSTVLVSTRSGTESVRAFRTRDGEEQWRSDGTVRWWAILLDDTYVGVGK